MNRVPEFGQIPIGDELNEWWSSLSSSDRVAWRSYASGPIPAELVDSRPRDYIDMRGDVAYPNPTLTAFLEDLPDV